MRAGGAPIAALLLISATLVIKVTSEDIYWEGEEDGSNEFLEVKEHDNSLSSHLSRIKRQWGLFDLWGSSSTTTAEPDTEDSTGDPVADPLTSDDETGDGSGAPSPVETSEPREKTLRVTFVAMQPYHEEYSNRDSARFQNFSKSLANAVNKIYEEQGRIGEISGTQRASLVRIQSRTSDDFSCKVTLDIVTTGYYDMDKITQILRDHIRNVQRLDGVVVKDTKEDSTANVIDPDDSINEISHREDEIPRQPVTERPLPPVADITEDYTSNQECNRDELACDFTRCVSLTKRCDGTRDCEDNSDEQNCAPIGHILYEEDVPIFVTVQS